MDVEGLEQLMRAAQAGDESALKRLLVEMRPYIAKVASGHVDASSTTESVSDLLQDVETRVWQRLGQFQGCLTAEGTMAKFRSWLVQIIRHIAMDRDRARNTLRRKPPGVRIVSLDGMRSSSDSSSGGGRLDPRAADPTPSAILRREERSDLVDQALEKVEDPVDREIIRRFFFEREPLARIAEDLGESYARVRTWYHRGLRQLERHLRPLRPD